MTDVAIIGGGFCGTMVAVHLARSGGCASIRLIDRSADPGPGLAYGTSDIRHLLNVRASNMSALADQPDHFVRWLVAHDHPFAPDSFVPRLIYGAYLRDVLRQAQADHPELSVVQADVMSLTPQGGRFALHMAGGQILEVCQVVLAMGNLPPGKGAQNPYDPALWDELAEPGDILIAGTGLTALDLIVTLAETKREGTIHVMSRSLMFPQMHAPAANYPAMFDGVTLPADPLRLMQAIRLEVRRMAHRGVPWQAVIDGLRHRNQELWQGMGPLGQRRFLKRLRPYWDTHRHRCAPEIMAVKTRLEGQGRLAMHRGAFLSTRTEADGMLVLWKPHGKAQAEELRVRRIVDCTGPQSDIARLKTGLLKSLLDSGLISVPDNRMGLCTDTGYAVLDASGSRVTGLYALGSLLKGRLYESVAVPELRMQAMQVAEAIVRK